MKVSRAVLGLRYKICARCMPSAQARWVSEELRGGVRYGMANGLYDDDMIMMSMRAILPARTEQDGFVGITYLDYGYVARGIYLRCEL